MAKRKVSAEETEEIVPDAIVQMRKILEEQEDLGYIVQRASPFVIKGPGEEEELEDYQSLNTFKTPFYNYKIFLSPANKTTKPEQLDADFRKALSMLEPEDYGLFKGTEQMTNVGKEVIEFPYCECFEIRGHFEAYSRKLFGRLIMAGVDDKEKTLKDNCEIAQNKDSLIANTRTIETSTTIVYLPNTAIANDVANKKFTTTEILDGDKVIETGYLRSKIAEYEGAQAYAQGTGIMGKLFSK